MAYFSFWIYSILFITVVIAAENDARKNRTKQFSKIKLQNEPAHDFSYRWLIYKGLETLGNELGLVGRSCMLRSICEAAEIPFDHRGGLMAELFHILLTPSSSFEKLSTHKDNEYFQAEQLGKSKADCSHIFRECEQSFLQHFSQVHEF